MNTVDDLRCIDFYQDPCWIFEYIWGLLSEVSSQLNVV